MGTSTGCTAAGPTRCRRYSHREECSALLTMAGLSNNTALLCSLSLSLSPPSLTFPRPGGELTPGETEAAGMNRVLNEVFGLDNTSAGEWPIVDRLATWWRPYFDPNCYPYVPVHCTKPKEQDSIHLIQLPEKCTFTVPKNYKLQAIPLYMLYEDKAAYGSVVSTLPQLLSRFTMTTI